MDRLTGRQAKNNRAPPTRLRGPNKIITIWNSLGLFTIYRQTVGAKMHSLSENVWRPLPHPVYSEKHLYLAGIFIWGFWWKNKKKSPKYETTK